MNQIKGVGYDGKVWLLIDEVTQVSVKRGETRESFRGVKSRVTGGRPPHKAGSTGRITTRDEGSYYPSVYGCEWQRV
jgi:hypothetical protein